MDRNDVLNYIKRLRGFVYSADEYNALSELEDAYIKAEPATPTIDSASRTKGLNVWCGKCGMHIDEICKRSGMWCFCNINTGCAPEEFEYCPYCGQKIDWSFLREE